MTRLLGYARVSTLDRNPRLQQDVVQEVGCWKIWTDYASGRPCRARGRRGGRPSVTTPEEAKQARGLYDEGERSVAAMAGVLGVSRSSIYQVLSKQAGKTHDLRIAG